MLVNNSGTLKMGQFYANYGGRIIDENDVESLHINKSGRILTLPAVKNLLLNRDTSANSIGSSPNSGLMCWQKGQWFSGLDQVRVWVVNGNVGGNNWGLLSNEGVFHVGCPKTDLKYTFPAVQGPLTVSVTFTATDYLVWRAPYCLDYGIRTEYIDGNKFTQYNSSGWTVEGSNIEVNLPAGGFSNFINITQCVIPEGDRTKAKLWVNGRFIGQVTWVGRVDQLSNLYLNRKDPNLLHSFANLKFRSIRIWKCELTDEEVQQVVSWDGLSVN